MLLLTTLQHPMANHRRLPSNEYYRCKAGVLLDWGPRMGHEGVVDLLICKLAYYDNHSFSTESIEFAAWMRLVDFLLFMANDYQAFLEDIRALLAGEGPFEPTLCPFRCRIWYPCCRHWCCRLNLRTRIRCSTIGGCQSWTSRRYSAVPKHLQGSHGKIEERRSLVGYGCLPIEEA